jgi:hypothetical protein
MSPGNSVLPDLKIILWEVSEGCKSKKCLGVLRGTKNESKIQSNFDGNFNYLIIL